MQALGEGPCRSIPGSARSSSATAEVSAHKALGHAIEDARSGVKQRRKGRASTRSDKKTIANWLWSHCYAPPPGSL